MRQLVIILILMFGVAAPSAGDVRPGGQIEVYDANDEFVGQLLGTSRDNYNWDVTVTTDSAEPAVVQFHQDGSFAWWDSPNYLYFAGSGCTGTPYASGNPGDHRALTSYLGNWHVAKAGVLYRFRGPASSHAVQSFSTNTGTCAEEAATYHNLVSGYAVGTLPNAFPFYIREVPPGTPYLPPWAFASIAGGIALSGGALAVRRRRDRLG